MFDVILPILGGASGFMLGGGLEGIIQGAVLGSAVSNLFGEKKQKSSASLPIQEGARLQDLRVQISSYGEVIPKVYGNMRLAGNIIWATDIKESVNEIDDNIEHTINYNYCVSLAIVICEGEVEEIVRVWADGTILTEDLLRSNQGKYNIHLGSENQLPDDIIGKYKAFNSYPAYRGLCYVVFDNLPLEQFDNRVPNFTFEVKRKVQIKPCVEDKIKEVVLIPGAGEFVYSDQIHVKRNTIKMDNKIEAYGAKNYINLHNYAHKANMLLAIEQMAKTLPNLQWVALVVTWFATSNIAANCQIIPKVEFSGDGTEITPIDWQVAGLTRDSAKIVLYFDEYTPTYGGTPSDQTIIEITNQLKQRGYKIMFYPMLFVDQISPEAKPWRGRITANSANEIINWFNQENGYNNFIVHYANLIKNKVDAFIIGSELVGLTGFTDNIGSYPTVNQLINLAARVKTILGYNTLITYAADWSEYHHTEGGWFNLDPLWTSPNIDFIGIDAYFPLTEDLPQRQITENLIKDGWQSGEGWQYYYDHTRSRRHYFSDGKYAWKNLEYWWSNYHQDPNGNYTAWQPKMKPIWFTEFGFPSVDGCSNQPNVFYDPSSCESHYPRGSRGRVSFFAQRQALNASLDYWQNKNSHSGLEQLVAKKFVWTYDARPFPFWPDLKNIWQDGNLWVTGHWINGKLGCSTLGAIIAEILSNTGLKADDYDVSRLTNEVTGYVISQHLTARDAIAQLQTSYFFDIVESDGILKFVPRIEASVTVSISEEELIPSNSHGNSTSNNQDIKETLEINLVQELELPQKVSLTHIECQQNYDYLTVETQRQTVNTKDQINFSLPIILDNQQAKQIVDIILYNSWQERVNYKLTLPPKYAYLEPTDIINVICQNAIHSLRIIKTDNQRTGQIKIIAKSFNINLYDFTSNTNYLPKKYDIPKPIATSILQLIDAPIFSSDNYIGYGGHGSNQGMLQLVVNADDSNWNGAIIYQSQDGEHYKPLFTTTNQATSGFLLNNFLPASSLIIDNQNIIVIQLLHGRLQTVNELTLLNGANKALIGNELIQFQEAELIGSNKYKLSKLLRGRQGTEWAINNHQIGDRFILLTDTTTLMPINNNLIDRPIHYKAVSIGKTLAETTPVTFTYTGKCLKPFAPVHVTAKYDKNYNIIISWIKRSRIDNEWRDYVDMPLSKEFEKYEIDIKCDQQLVRILESSCQSVIYSKEQQLADSVVTNQNMIVPKLTATIYQLSSLVGRGYETTISLNNIN